MPSPHSATVFSVLLPEFPPYTHTNGIVAQFPHQYNLPQRPCPFLRLPALAPAAAKLNAFKTTSVVGKSGLNKDGTVKV